MDTKEYTQVFEKLNLKCIFKSDKLIISSGSENKELIFAIKDILEKYCNIEFNDENLNFCYLENVNYTISLKDNDIEKFKLFFVIIEHYISDINILRKQGKLIIDKIKKEEEENKHKIDDAIQSFTNKRDLAAKFIKIQPMFYDRSKNFWIWDFNKYSWDIIDEVDLLNLISRCSRTDTISSKEKSEIIESLKQVGRISHPKNIESHWIQFKDTIYDYKIGKKFKATPDYFSTNPIPWEISDNKETPNIDKLFKEWVGEDYILTLKEIASYCMISNYPIHRIFCFLGSGRNGKSKYLKFIEKLIGSDNVSAVELDSLMKSRFEMFNLYKKLAVQMGETNFTTMSRTAILKKLTGQDKVSFEAKNKDPISDINYAKLLVSTNNLPDTEDNTDGFFRRWLCIDFPNEFPEGKEVLNRIPIEEYSNFCRSAIDIIPKLLERGGFTNEGTIEERQKRYEERSNPFDKFIKECCVEYEDEFIFKHEFKKDYLEWCKKNRFRPPSDREISEKMKKHGIVEKKKESENYDDERKEYKRYRAWIGIGWKHKNIDKDFVKKLTTDEKLKKYEDAGYV